MAYQIDTNQFNIVITALGEGFGQLANIIITDITMATSYTLDIASQVWSPGPPTANPGDSIELVATIQNNSTIQDNIFGTFSSGQVTPNESSAQAQVIMPGGIFTPLWTFTMPGYDVNITISAGHEE